MLCQTVSELRKIQPYDAYFHFLPNADSHAAETPSERFYTRHRKTANRHHFRWNWTHHDGQSVEHNTKSEDDSGMTRNAPLEATLGIEPSDNFLSVQVDHQKYAECLRNDHRMITECKISVFPKPSSWRFSSSIRTGRKRHDQRSALNACRCQASC